jgi:hypothetical protein
MVGTRSRLIRVGTSVELIAGEGRAKLRVGRGSVRAEGDAPTSARTEPRPTRSLALPSLTTSTSVFGLNLPAIPQS